MLTRSKFAIVALAILVPLVAPGLAGAQSGPAQGCSGAAVATFPGVGFDARDVSVASKGHLPTSLSLAVNIPPGTYDIDAVAYDGDPDRATETQPREYFFVEFLDGGGAVMATTGVTGELPDGENEATWAGSLGTVVLPDTAVQLRATHGFIGGTVVNSVMPSCVGYTLVAPPTTSTTTTTTSPPPPASTSTTTPPPSSTTPTTTVTTTTTVPTTVLPEVETSPDPDPQVTTPTFTG